MKGLTKIEEIMLIAILRLKEEVYGYKIRKHISGELNMEITYGNLYSVLNQLVDKEYVIKTVGEATEKRQGKNKNYYTVSKMGLDALRASFQMNETLWDGMSEIIFGLHN